MTKIRPLRVDDARRLAELHLAVWRAAYGGLVPAGGFDTVDLHERAERWRRTARGEADPARSVLVAVDGDALVGFVAFGVPEDDVGAGTGEIGALYVDETRWGTNVGYRLLQAALRALADTGHNRAYLWVLEDNPRARRFYERAGLTPDGSRNLIDFLGTSLPELRYAGPTAAMSPTIGKVGA